LKTRDFSAAELAQLVARQLGRIPEIDYRVAINCVFGWPSVLANAPVNKSGEPNPNLYYLSCPWLRRELARLEDSGFIKVLQKMIAGDINLSKDLSAAQLLYSREMASSLAALGIDNSSGNFLIAGSREPQLLKCLHAHFAFFLVHPDYELGRKLAAVLEKQNCEDERCAIWMAEIKASGGNYN